MREEMEVLEMRLVDARFGDVAQNFDVNFDSGGNRSGQWEWR